MLNEKASIINTIVKRCILNNGSRKVKTNVEKRHNLNIKILLPDQYLLRGKISFIGIFL